MAGQGSNIITKIEVTQETDSNGVSVVKAKMKAGVDHIKLFQETEVQGTKLLKLTLLETVNNKKGAPIANALVKIKVGADWKYVFSNEKGEVQFVWKAPGTPTEAEIVSAPGYLFATPSGPAVVDDSGYKLFAKADKSEKIVLNNQDAAANNTTYHVNKDGAFKDLADDLSKEVYLEKDPGVITKFGKINITTVARDLEAVQKPVQGVEYTLFKGSEVITKGETNQYGKVTLKNIPVPKESEFKQPFTVPETLTKEYTLKQTKVPAGYVQDKLAYTVKFTVTRTDDNAYTSVPDNLTYNMRFDVNAPALRDLAGYNRFGTAARISQKIYDTASIASDAKKVPAIVIVNGLDFADGLAAGPFAQKFDGKNPSTGVADAAYKTAPVLLVTKNEIPEETLKEIKRLTNDKEGAALKKTKIYVIGGKNAVSDDVVSKLRALKGVSELNVLAGANRYETAAIVAKTMHDFGALSEVVLVNGLDFADALGGGTLAIAKGAALLLNHPKEATPETADFIAKPEIKKVTVIGGKNAISDEAIKGYKATITRVFGADRYETSVEVAKSISGAAKAYVASGLTFADALALTPYIRMTGSDGIILLTAPKELPMSVRKFLNTNKATFAPYGTNTFIVGGENAVSAEVEKVLKEEVLKTMEIGRASCRERV